MGSSSSWFRGALQGDDGNAQASGQSEADFMLIARIFRPFAARKLVWHALDEQPGRGAPSELQQRLKPAGIAAPGARIAAFDVQDFSTISSLAPMPKRASAFHPQAPSDLDGKKTQRDWIASEIQEARNEQRTAKRGQEEAEATANGAPRFDFADKNWRYLAAAERRALHEQEADTQLEQQMLQREITLMKRLERLEHSQEGGERPLQASAEEEKPPGPMIGKTDTGGADGGELGHLAVLRVGGGRNDRSGKLVSLPMIANGKSLPPPMVVPKELAPVPVGTPASCAPRLDEAEAQDLQGQTPAPEGPVIELTPHMRKEELAVQGQILGRTIGINTFSPGAQMEAEQDLRELAKSNAKENGVLSMNKAGDLGGLLGVPTPALYLASLGPRPSPARAAGARPTRSDCLSWHRSALGGLFL